MNSYFIPTRLLFAAFCIILDISAAQMAYSQDTSTRKEQNSQSAQLPIPSSTERQDRQTLPQANRQAYAGFLDRVGEEDARIRREIQEGKENVAPRMNYSKGMDIKPDEEETLRAIADNAYSRFVEAKKQFQEVCDEVHRKHIPWPREGGRPEFEPVAQNTKRIVDESVAELKNGLGEETFRNLDSWLFKRELFEDFSVLRNVDGTTVMAPVPITGSRNSPGSISNIGQY